MRPAKKKFWQTEDELGLEVVSIQVEAGAVRTRAPRGHSLSQGGEGAIFPS